MKPTVQTYQACQPAMLCLNKRRKIMRCKKHNPYKRPYKTVHIKPPAHLENRWYFQKELAETPLLLTMSAALSLDRWYAASNSISTTVGFTGLNTELFEYHNLLHSGTTGYKPTDNKYFYTFQQGQTTLPKITEIFATNLIFLGQTQKMDPGTTIKDTPGNNFQEKFNTWKSNSGYWGNIFLPPYIKGPAPLLVSSKYPTQLPFTSESEKLKEGDFQYYTKPLLINYRYNPYYDKGDDNIAYLVDLNSGTKGWEPSVDPGLKVTNLPLWMLLFGLIDFWKLKYNSTPIETQRAIAIHTKYIEPKDQHPIVPIDDDMLTGTSPFRPLKETTPADKLNWHVKLAFQQRSINNIAACGPGTVKLPPNVSVEGHAVYSFYFKLGGCTPPTKNIEDPEIQPIFPGPNNILEKRSFQGPEIPIENFLYNFDWRRGLLTEKATKRMQKYCLTEKSISESPGPDPFNPAPYETTSETDSSDTEKEKETLQQLLNQQRKKQQKFKQRILQLLTM